MDSQWLKAQFEYFPDKSKSDLASVLGLESPAISKILSGARQIKAQEYIKMRQFFGLPVDGDSSAVAKTLQKAQDNYAHTSRLSEKERPKWNTVLPPVIEGQNDLSRTRTRIFENREAIMEPEYKKGEHVLVDLESVKPSPEGAFVISDGYGFMIRHCRYKDKAEPAKIIVSASNSDFDPQVLLEGDVQIIGRVIAKLTMV